MARTGFYCIYEMKDTTAIPDSELSSEYNQSFGELAMMKENIEAANYATLEQDFFLLDGNQKELQEEPEDVVYFSNILSNEKGLFETPPELMISFSQNHTSIGLTFYFQDDPPLQMKVVWYDIYGIQIAEQEYDVDNIIFFARNQVENYAEIKVVFLRTKPYRYVKLRYIEYGTDLIMGEGGMPVKGASLIEETSPISDKLAINKLSYKLIDEADEFNVGNITGLHKALQKRQRMQAYEKMDGKEFLLGTFFLDSFKSDKNVTSLSTVDYKGLLDDYRFLEGRVYTGDLAGDIIDEIMTAAGIEAYEVTDEVRQEQLYGWLKIQTCRKALREVLFACGAVLDSTRNDGIRIYKPKRDVEASIERNRKFSTAVYDQAYISDVTLKYTEYTLADVESQIVKGHYTAGTYTIELSSPATNMTINTGEILSQSYNYVQFQVLEDAEVIIMGMKYSKTDLSVTSSVSAVNAGKVRKSVSLSGTLLNTAVAKIRAEAILEYYLLRIGIKIRFLNQGELPGIWSDIQNNRRTFGNYLAGIEKMTTDLTGGFISTAELRGYYKLVSDYYYTGEIISGEDMGVL